MTEKDANYNIRRRLMINSKIPQGGLWHTKKVFFGVPFKFVINILKLLTYPGTYYEQCCAFKMTKISLGRYLNSQEKLKTMLMQNFGVPKKSIMVCYDIFWSGQFSIPKGTFIESAFSNSLIIHKENTKEINV